MRYIWRSGQGASRRDLRNYLVYFTALPSRWVVVKRLFNLVEAVSQEFDFVFQI